MSRSAPLSRPCPLLRRATFLQPCRSVRARLLGGFLSIAALLIGTLLTGCSPSAPAAMAPMTPVVRVVEIKPEDVVDYEYFTGRTEAIEAVDIRARVTGYLTEVCFKPGDDVAAGARLFKIDPANYLIAMDRAQAELLQAQARRQLADANVARAKNLASGAISKQEADQYYSAPW